MTAEAVEITRHYIDGEWVEASKGETYDLFNPSTGEVMARAAAGGRADAHRAIAAARSSFDRGVWRDRTQEQRSAALMDVAAALLEMSDEWPLVEAANAGATLRKTSIVDVPMALEHFRVLAQQALSVPWYEPLPWVDIPQVSWNFVQREAIGVCAGIVPWNYPMMMAVWKIAPAVAMGNSIVLKPSPLTPLSAIRLVEAIDKTGLIPRGVINLVTGPNPDLGEALVSSTDVDKVAFTGSTVTGKAIARAAANNLTKVTLELGGKSASIVCADADLDVAVDGILFGTFFHQGQMCEAGTRVYIHDSIYDDCVSQLVAKAKVLRVGDACDIDSQLGPIISKAQYDKVTSYIEMATKVGGKILCGGGRPDGVPAGGYYLQPTIIEGLPEDSAPACDEIFGPVMTIFRWSDLGDVLTRANSSMYGLAGGVWSKDTRMAIQIAKRLRTGTVWINDWHLINALAPFGGYRQSGLGRELGTYGLREYTEMKHIHVDQNVPREDRFAYDILLGD